MKSKPLGKAICPCGTEFQKNSPSHKYCSEKCRKISVNERDRLRREKVKYDFILDMETWTWKEK